MDNRLNLEKIYEKFLKNEITQNEFLKLLESLINENDDEEFRAYAIDLLENFPVINGKISQIVENSLISDESSLVRTTAAKFIINKNLENAQDALKWLIQNEKSILFFKKILEFLNHTLNPELKKIKERILERLTKIYNLNNPDAMFILDLDFLDYKKFIKDFNDFLSKFEIKEEEKKKLIKENTQIGYKGLGRISLTKDGYIISLILADLEEIPKSLQYLSNLKFLEVNRCKIGNLPDSFGNLSQLKKLTLKNNEIEVIPNWVLKVASRAYYTEKYIKNGVNSEEAYILGLLEILTGQAFVKLELENLFYSSQLFYYKINQNGNIITIHISSELSYIGIFPKSLCKLGHLEELSMVNQNIKVIPDCIGELRTLRSLNLNFNKIRVIPDAIGNLENLEYLYLENQDNHHTIKYISNDLINLKQLKILELSGNTIENIPNSLKMLKALKM